jgi:tetratricopeptide (TPR) repeat protein
LRSILIWHQPTLALANTQINFDWNWDAANSSISKAAALEPGSVEVLRIRSYRSRILGDLDQAIELHERVVALDPLSATSYWRLGYMLYAAGRYDEARAAMQKALDLNPQGAYIHLTFDKILIAEGKTAAGARTNREGTEPLGETHGPSTGLSCART